MVKKDVDEVVCKLMFDVVKVNENWIGGKDVIIKTEA